VQLGAEVSVPVGEIPGSYLISRWIERLDAQ
jgi:hypothetical protein